MDEKENIVGSDYFEENKKDIFTAIEELDELYDETKEHFDAVKRARSNGSLAFIHLQTSNLVSIKNSKFSVLKELINIKKIEAELTLKESRNQLGGSQDDSIVHSLMKQLMDKEDVIDYDDDDNFPPIKGKHKEEDVDEVLTRKIRELRDSGEMQFSDNELGFKYEDQEVQIVVVVKNKKWQFGAITEDGTRIKDYPVPKKSDYQIRLEKVDGKTVAVDQDDKIYRVIREK